MKHISIAILGSTKGTDAFHILQSIHDGILQGIKVECVISNREKAPILDSARRFNVPAIFLSAKRDLVVPLIVPSNASSNAPSIVSSNAPSIVLSIPPSTTSSITNEEYDRKLLDVLAKYNVDYVLLIGWMRILSEMFVCEMKNKIINIHPSLLPAFEGNMDMNIHRAVIERGCKVTGATLMFVDQGVDTGPIIAQFPVMVNETDTPETLKNRVQKAEKQLFMDYLPLLRDGRVELVENKVHIKSLF